MTISRDWEYFRRLHKKQFREWDKVIEDVSFEDAVIDENIHGKPTHPDYIINSGESSLND